MRYLNPPMLSAGFTPQGKKVRQRLENILKRDHKKKGYFLPMCALALLMAGALVACASAQAAEMPTVAPDTLTSSAPTVASEEETAAAESAAQTVPAEPEEDCLCEPLEEPEAETEPVLYRAPLAESARILAGFGGRVHPITGQTAWHYGVDLQAAEGTAVYASADGTVTAAVYGPVYGHHVVVTHADGSTSLYAHLQSLSVTAGQTVAAGDLLGLSGQSGWATGPHLHFEIRDAAGAAMDPTAVVS